MSTSLLNDIAERRQIVWHTQQTECYMKHAAGGQSPRDQNPLAKEGETIIHSYQVAR